MLRELRRLANTEVREAQNLIEQVTRWSCEAVVLCAGRTLPAPRRMAVSSRQRASGH